MENSELSMYLFKVMTIQGVFFFLYYFFLKNRTTYSLNRGYLLGTLFLAFLIPVLEIPVSEKSIPMLPTDAEVFEWESENAIGGGVSIGEVSTVESPQPVNYSTIIQWIYLVLAFTLIVRSIFHLLVLQKLKKQSVYVERKWFKLFKTSQIHPFSFLSNIFIPKKIFGTNSFDQILEHECEHVRQRHSIDRLLIDFMVALFWFNPFMYLYRRALIEIHEYQADAAVIKKFPDPIGYQEVLFSQLKASPYSGLVSHFNFSTIKKRIVMINKQKNKRAAWAYLLAAPVTFFVILAFANKTMDEPMITQEAEPVKIAELVPIISPSEKTSKTEIEEAFEPIVVPKTQQNNFLPSILPLKDAGNMKVSSGFGMRIDPIDKKEKMHKGLDLRTPEGSIVIATADGTVHEASYHDKYGYYVLIEHGDQYMTRYSQLSKLNVKRGDKVKRSQEIALSGNTGRSTGPHLHYEVVEVGVGHKDPRDYIKDHKFSRAVLIPEPSPENKEEERAVVVMELAEAEAVARHLERIELEKMEMERRMVEAEMKAMEKEREMVEAERSIIEKEREKVEAEMKAIEMEREKGEEVLSLLRREQRAFLDPEKMTDDPIYILDGKEIDQKEVNNLNLDLIERIEVSRGKETLKKYGSKAEGGVIEIETKKANKTKSKEKIKQDGFSKSENNRDPLKAVLDVAHRVATKVTTKNQERFSQKLDDVSKLIDLKKFVLNATFLHGRQGERVIVFSDNYMMVDNDTFVFQTALPNEVGLNGLGGVTATGSITSYKVKRNKKNSAITVLVEVNTNQFGQGTITFKIDGSGYESANFVSSRGQMITMLGSIESIENAGVYKGISRF